MVPDKFNMVDMEGIDILFSYGDVIPGLYQKLVESITPCRYQCLYNWYFDGVLIPPTYVEMAVNQDTNDVWINGRVFVTSDDRILVHLPSIETVSGAIVNITDALPRKVEDLICYINPFQAGSGNPSPDNIRLISGFSAIKVYDEEMYDTTAAPKLTLNWQDIAGTIYEGTVTFNDDGSADLVSDGMFFEFDGTEDWQLNGSATSSSYYYVALNAQLTANACVCSHAVQYAISINNSGLGANIATVSGNMSFLTRLSEDAVARRNVEQFKMWLAAQKENGTPLTAVGKLTAPSSYHFYNVGQLYTRLGTNVIWHDANGDISVIYWKE